MTSPDQITLFHWIEGAFPKRVSYFLFIKGLVDTPQQLHDGKTNDGNFNIVPIYFENSNFVTREHTESKPEGKSVPSLRIRHGDSGQETWIHDSASIILYLDQKYEGPSMTSTSPLDRALTNDIFLRLTETGVDGLYYLKNASPATAAWSGMSSEDRNIRTGKYAKSMMIKGLLKVQEWARPALQSTGWLTPGLDHPGLIDISVAYWARYWDLSYELDLLEHDELVDLRAWRDRFQSLDWWQEIEVKHSRFPDALRHSKEELEA